MLFCTKLKLYNYWICEKIFFSFRSCKERKWFLFIKTVRKKILLNIEAKRNSLHTWIVWRKSFFNITNYNIHFSPLSVIFLFHDILISFYYFNIFKNLSYFIYHIHVYFSIFYFRFLRFVISWAGKVLLHKSMQDFCSYSSISGQWFPSTNLVENSSMDWTRERGKVKQREKNKKRKKEKEQ